MRRTMRMRTRTTEIENEEGSCDLLAFVGGVALRSVAVEGTRACQTQRATETMKKTRSQRRRCDGDEEGKEAEGEEQGTKEVLQTVLPLLL